MIPTEAEESPISNMVTESALDWRVREAPGGRAWVECVKGRGAHRKSVLQKACSVPDRLKVQWLGATCPGLRGDKTAGSSVQTLKVFLLPASGFYPGTYGRPPRVKGKEYIFASDIHLSYKLEFQLVCWITKK